MKKLATTIAVFLLSLLTCTASYAVEVTPIRTRSTLDGSFLDASAVVIQEHVYVTNCHNLVHRTQIILGGSRKGTYSNVYMLASHDLCFFGDRVTDTMLASSGVEIDGEVHVSGFTPGERAWSSQDSRILSYDEKTMHISSAWPEGVSGGAVVNAKGELIGISTYISRTRAYGVAVRLTPALLSGLKYVSIRSIDYPSIDFYADKLVLNR